MQNVDCDYMGFESHECRHNEVSKGWIRSWWPKQCMEYKDVRCPHRESIWDELQKDHTPKAKQRIRRGSRHVIKIKFIG